MDAQDSRLPPDVAAQRTKKGQRSLLICRAKSDALAPRMQPRNYPGPLLPKRSS